MTDDKNLPWDSTNIPTIRERTSDDGAQAAVDKCAAMSDDDGMHPLGSLDADLRCALITLRDLTSDRVPVLTARQCRLAVEHLNEQIAQLGSVD